MKKINLLISTFFGNGYISKIPGTFTSLTTTIILYFSFEILQYQNLNYILILYSIIFFYSFYAVMDSETEFINKDPRQIVIDEVLGQSMPIIFIVYLIFPRTEINFKLFETSTNNLGIPDKISLGSFEDISNSDESVFIFTPQNTEEIKKYYFRVKVFNIIDENKNWVSADGNELIKRYSKNIKIDLEQSSKKTYGKIIILPHEKKWLPKLANHSYKNQQIIKNLFDNLSFSNQKNRKPKNYRHLCCIRKNMYT